MKKRNVLVVLLAVFITLVGISGVYLKQEYFTTTTYYTKIIDNGSKTQEKIDNTNEIFIDYLYTQKAVDSSGNIIDVSFKANRDKPLKQNRYLKLNYHERKGVMSWEEVNKNEIPEKALKILDRK